MGRKTGERTWCEIEANAKETRRRFLAIAPHPLIWAEALSLKGKRLDFYGRVDTHVSLTNTVPKLSRFTACIDLVFADDKLIVSENITIQEMSTTLSQQIDLTTPSQTPVAETTRFTADILSTSAAITLPTKSTSIGTTTNSMKITKSPSSESTRTTKMAEAIATETFHPTTATNFLYMSGLTKNSIISKTSVTGSQSTIRKTTSLFSSAESIPISTTSWPKHKSTGIDAPSITTASQEFLAFTAAGIVPWSTVEETSATTTHVGTASTFPPESVLSSTVAPVDSKSDSIHIGKTGMEIASPVHSKTLPTRPIEMMPVLTAETELTSTNFQDVSSPRMVDTISTFIPKRASSVALSFKTSSPFTRAQSVQPVIDAETTHTALTLGVTLAPMATDTLLPPITPGPVYTQNTPTGGGNMLPLNATRSASTFKASESGHTSITDDGAHLFATNETTWTPRPDQTLWTSAFHGSASNAGHSSTASTATTPPEAPSGSEATTITDASVTAGASTDRYATALSTLTTSWLANFTTVSGTTSVTKLPEIKLTTLGHKTTPLPTAAGGELLSTPRETLVPPVDIIPTLADIGPNVSTEESANGLVTRTETASRYLEGKSTLAVTTELSPFATMLEATESAQW
ncbi:hypothetical protein GH733_019477 [Mirounga leonina]|nr:hypothetical protein GH733_019477 [Mirounga leonina]